MAMYELQELVNIREIRENRASQEVAAKTKALEQAVLQAAQRRQELVDYRLWKVEERDRIYARILRKAVALPDLEKLKELLAGLEEKESLVEKKILLADRAVTDAQAALEDARQKWHSALNNLRKLQEHRKSWMEEARIEDERNEEKEAEELRVVGMGTVGSDADEY